MVGRNGLYPSRSELIRVAVREFLIKELKLANNMAKYKDPEPEEEDFDDENFVRVPTESVNEKSEPIREYKSYKILKRLNYNGSDEKPKPVDRGEFLGKVKYGDSLDDVPHPSNHTHQSFAQQRIESPNETYLKYINEL